MGSGRGKSRRAQTSSTNSEALEAALAKLPAFKAFEKAELQIDDVYLYVSERKPRGLQGEDSRPAVTQELAVFPQKLTYCELPEHIIISYDDGIDFDRERPGWLEICNARDRGTGEGPEFHFQKDEFQAGLDALTSDEPRFFYALPELFRKEGRNALVRGYDAADPERKPFVFLVNAWGEETEDERLQQQFADSGGYAWKDDGDMHFRVLSFWRAEDAVSVSKAITQMAANKAEFDALLEERERLRQEFNPLAVNEQFEPVTF